jgi:hypothetical protein
MAQAPEGKKRRASGPRTQRPVFAVVTYQDENGNSVALNKAGMNIRIERDAAKLLELVTGEGIQNATVLRVELPQPQQRAKAEASAS